VTAFMSDAVASFLRTKRAVILQRWQVRVAAMVTELSVSRIELIDHMPDFVDGLIVLLEVPLAQAQALDAPGREAAPLHGAQRLNVGFDVDEVFREYGILADVLLEVVNESSVAIAD